MTSDGMEDFRELIRGLIDENNADQSQEYRKNILRSLGMSSDTPFSITAPATLAKLSLLAFAGARNSQSVYAEALRSAIVVADDVLAHGAQYDVRRRVVMENRRALFADNTGRQLLIRLIEASWANDKSNDFCDDALDVLSKRLPDLIGNNLS